MIILSEMRAVSFCFFLLGMDWVWGLDTKTFDGDVRDFAVGDKFVYVVTDYRLYQLNHNFTNVTMRDINVFNTTERDPFRIKMLLPFITNQTLITCGIKKCGFCEILDLNNISTSVHFEDIEVGSLNLTYSTIAFIVDVEMKSYIMAGKLKVPTKCVDEDEFLVLRNTQDGDTGGMFSQLDRGTNPIVQNKNNKLIDFVDGFQISSYIYLFLNILDENKVRLLWFLSKTDKSNTLKSLKGATLWCCDDMERRRLLSSSVIPDTTVPTGKVLWAGVFTGGNTLDPVNTVLAIYDISPSGQTATDPDFWLDGTPKPTINKPLVLKPLMVLFKYSSMTSVLVQRHNSWIVFFIGTEDGQLIKLAVDTNYHVSCPRVLYKSVDDNYLFPKMHLDPVDRKHVYMVVRNQMIRVPVAQCSGHKSFKECWSGQDPYCGWCVTESRCSFLDDCDPTSNWLSIPDDHHQQRLVSYQVEKSISGEKITLTVEVNMKVRTESPVFACNFASNLCDTTTPAPVFPRCFCKFSSDKLPAKGLEVNVKIRVERVSLPEKLMLTNCSDITGPPTSVLCSQCMTAGCSWNNNVCSWSRSANRGPIQDICSQYGMNYSEPEIISIEPSVLSVHGRNHALMTGKNLDDVVRIQMQRGIACIPNESPVWNHTGSNLTFHIPSDDKGSVSVCAVLPDGRCLGEAIVTYRSSPTCTGLSPANTWASGNRKTFVLGSHLEFVEGVVHPNAAQIITTNYSSKKLWYHTPPYGVGEVLPITINVFLRVANQTLPCSSQLTYHHDPQFTSFTATRTGNDLRITIEKNADNFNITISEISVWGVLQENQYVECVMEVIKTSNDTEFIICRIKNTPNINILSLEIKMGNFVKKLEPKTTSFPLVILVPVAIIIIISVIVVRFFYVKQRKMAAQINQQLECDIRNDIL
ncbi:hypothetical protein DPEC_G00111230 [Dallia pectoralis]|uniref:Uncharacterized protein n=1 Tax=Dallia pectoralis TaxID=75939 RepID=A0ACC2GSW2_DALPE|nr:hypothetical protein DPEC_G00111230 [Dallia pectoralis]